MLVDKFLICSYLLEVVERGMKGEVEMLVVMLFRNSFGDIIFSMLYFFKNWIFWLCIMVFISFKMLFVLFLLMFFFGYYGCMVDVDEEDYDFCKVGECVVWRVCEIFYFYLYWLVI